MAALQLPTIWQTTAVPTTCSTCSPPWFQHRAQHARGDALGAARHGVQPADASLPAGDSSTATSTG
eukprot:6519413-Prymnesium_polylepis.1